MKWALGLMVTGLMLASLPGLAQTTTTNKSSQSSAAHAASATHATAAKSATTKTTTKKKSSTASSTAVRTSGKSSSSKAHRTTHGKARAAGPAVQNHPDSARYQQIQQALSDEGYFKGDVNGAWGADSQDALLRFQADKKLDADGKITALTLENLGLGPKHDGSATPLSGRPATTPPPTAQIPSLNAPASGAPEDVPAQVTPQTAIQHPTGTPQQNR
jgi:Putative peptidoglycan binding domain